MVSGQWGQDADCHPNRDTKQEGMWTMPQECDHTQQSLSRCVKSEGLVHMTKVLLAVHSRQVTTLKDHIQHTQHGIGRYHCLLAFCVHGTLCVHHLKVSINHTCVSPLDTSWSKQYIKCTQITVKR